MDKEKNLKLFFIKLISISIAIIIIINVLFNLVISNIGFFDKAMSLTELENRREQGQKIRDGLNDLLTKENIINEEDKVLLYKIYQKLKSEFEDIK